MTNYDRRILPNPGLEKLRKYDDDLLKALNLQDENLSTILEKGLNFDEHFDAYYAVFTSHATPDTEFSVSHDLGKVPIGFIVVSRNKAGIIYDSGTQNTDSLIYLKCNVASTTAKILVF